MTAEVNHQNKRARLILDEVNYEDSEHTFYLDLPPYSQKDSFVKFVADSEMDLLSVSFSFSDGNLTGIENLFTLRLDYDKYGGGEVMRLNVDMGFEFKLVPWKVNESLASIIVNFARISFVNKLDGPSSDADPHVLLFDEYSTEKVGFLKGYSPVAYMDWDSNYSGIKITINVSKRAEGLVDIVTSKPMMALPNSNVLTSKVVNKSFSEYFLAENLSDCKVEVGGKTFPAHQFVLIEVSGFFQGLFSTDVENPNRLWKIVDFEPEVVEEFLEYAYKGTSNNLTLAENTKILMGLFRMGHKYHVVPLKAHCEKLLNNLINLENVVDLFEFGLLFQLESLKSAAKSYFTRFKLQIIPNFAAFLNFQKKYPAIINYKLAIE